jgi:Zn-dependent peptidase ImmA (M78 family)
VSGVKEVEQQANYFAAEFLMPASDIAHELPAPVTAVKAASARG